MKKKQPERETPFFARFLENQHLEQVAGNATTKYPSDSDEEVTLKYPSDDDEEVTLKYPSDDDEGTTY